MFFMYIPTILNILSAICVVISFPTMTIWNDLRLGFCLLGMGISTHVVLDWLFSSVSIEESEDKDNFSDKC